MLFRSLIYQNGELKSPWKPDALETVKNLVRSLLTTKKNLILHNAIFDCRVFVNWLGVNPLEFVFADTMLLAHTVYNEEGPLGLKPLAAELIDQNAALPQADVKASVAANGGTTTKTNFEMFKCDYKILGRYACYDAAYTIQLFRILYPKLKQNAKLETLWNEEVMPLLSVSYELNNNGCRINVPYFEKLRTDIQTNIDKIENELHSAIQAKLGNYELNKVLEEVKITERSALGRLLWERFGYYDADDKNQQEVILEIGRAHV